MIFFLWLLNLVISIFNAWGCGKTWNETRYIGGFLHLMNWMGAIMAACGFTWCYLVVFAVVGQVIPVTPEEGVEVAETVYLLDAETAKIMFQLGYTVIILPVIGSGTMITLQSWAHFYRKRSFANAAVAGYNTLADVYNIYGAVRHMPGILDDLGGFFGSGSGGSSSSSGKDSGKAAIVILLVAFAVLGGVITTYLIITSTARSHANEMRYRYDLAA